MASWSLVQLAALCTVLSFFYVSVSLDRHSLTARPRLSSILVLLFSGCVCFIASFLAKLLPGADGRFTAARREHEGGPLLAETGDAASTASTANLPARPRKLSLPLVIILIAVRFEVFHRINKMQQCSTPGSESFLLPFLVVLDIFTSRRKWGHAPTMDADDPWRTMWQDFEEWLSGPRPTMFFNAAAAFTVSTGTYFAVTNFTRSSYFCFRLTDSWAESRALRLTGLLLDAVIVTLLWRLLAWTRTLKLRLRTLGTVLTLSSVCMVPLYVGGRLYSGQGRLDLAFGSLYGFDLVVDSIAFGFMMISAAFYICETSPIHASFTITFFVGLVSSMQNLGSLGDWEHNSRAAAFLPLWLITIGFNFFTFCHDIRYIVFFRRTILFVLLGALTISMTIYALVRPMANFPKRHPIKDMTYAANVELDRWLMTVSVSTTAHVGVSEYQERHGGRNPPPKYEEWYRFAQTHNSLVMDDYSQIDRDLAPFWGLSAENIRNRAELMVKQPGVASIKIQDGAVSRGDAGDEGLNQDLDEIIEFIKPFSEHLPGMTLPINLSPTPRILPSWEEAHSNHRADLSSLVDMISRRSLGEGLEANQTTTSFDLRSFFGQQDESLQGPISIGEYRQMQVEGCPPGSRTRSRPHWNIAAFCSECAKPHSLDQTMATWSTSLETCQQPDLAYLHALSMTTPEATPITQLVPLFGSAKTDSFTDIVIPFPRSRLEQEDIEWPFDQRYDSLVWRGSVGDRPVNAQALRGSHKYRLLHMIADPAPSDRVTMVLTTPGTKTGFRYEKVYTEDASSVIPFNVGLTDLESCSSPQCALLKEAYGSRTEPTEILEHRYVLLLDEDASPPSQLIRTLRSHSVPFVSTIFRTWYTERLMPWLHFVPIDPRFQALHSTFAYFTGTEDRPDINGRATDMKGLRSDAEWIAWEGKKWAAKALRDEDMQVYWFRLLLEWARLIDDDREKVGTWKDDKGILYDSGWTQRKAS